MTGDLAKTNPFRFSTKYQDDETDLLYYGYRYYNASTGRWISRDPIEEWGGLNVHCLVGNDPVNWVDLLGLRQLTDEERKIIACLRDTSNCDKCRTEDMKAKLLDLANRLQKAIEGVKGNETPCRIKITVNALKAFCSPKSQFVDTGKNLCSPYVRDVLRQSGTTFKNQPNAGAFLNGDDRNFNRDYGFPAPSIPAAQAQMGDIISAGTAGTQAGFTSHVGIFLGDDLYVSQSPSDYPSQATGHTAAPQSEIKIRPIAQFKDWPKTNYRDTSKACQ